MAIEKSRKNKKVIAISSISAATAAALGLGTFTFLLNQNEKQKQVERYESPFEILKRKRNEILEYITSNGIENTSEMLIDLLNQCEKLSSSQSTTIDEVISLVNKIDYELLFEKIKTDIRNEQNIDQSMNNLKDLFNEKSIKEVTDKLIDQYKNRINSASSAEDKNKLVDELKELLTDPYKNQNVITEKLQKAMIQADNLLNNSEIKISDDLREQIESLLDRIDSIKNIDANTSDILADRLLELLDKAKKENDLKKLDQIKFENRVNEALKNLDTQELDPNVKEKIKQEINDLLNASKKEPNKDNFFLNYEILNKNLDDLINESINFDKSVEELNEILNSLLNSGLNFRENEIKEKEVYNRTLNKINESTNKEDKDSLLQSIKEIKQNQNYILGLRSEFDSTEKFTNELIESKLLDSSFSDILKNLLQNNTIENLEEKELNQVIESDHKELSNFLATVKNEISLNNEIVKQLNEINDLKAKNKTLSSKKINDLYKNFEQLKNNVATDEKLYNQKFDTFNELSEQLRNLHKEELANLIDKTNSFLDKEYISESLKDKIKQAVLVSTPFSKEESPATIVQIKPKEDLLRQLLKESQRQENHYIYNNKVDESLDNALNNSNLGNSTSETADKYKDKINKYFENAKNEIDKINNNDNSENADKLVQIDKIIEKLQKAEENVKSLDDYVNFVDMVNEEIEKIQDPALKQALKDKINKLKDIIDENYNELDDLESVSISDMKKKLQDALNEFQDLKEVILTNRLYEDTLQKISYTFINDKDGREDTPMESALKNSLMELKDKLLTLEKDSLEYNKTVSDIIDLRDNIENARELEYRNNQLKNNLDNIPYYDFGDYKPTSVISDAENTYSSTKSYIDNLQNNPSVFYENIQEIKDRTDTVIQKNENLNREVAQASLRNTVNKLEKNKTTLTGEVFDKVNESIQNLINNSNPYLDKYTSRNSQEINDYNFAISTNVELAQVLKEAQEQLKSLQDKKKDFIAEQLEAKILNNLINPSDSFDTIQKKINNLRDEVSLIKDKLNLEAKLEELKNIFPTKEDSEYRKIYDEVITDFSKKYNDYFEQYKSVTDNSSNIRSIEFDVIKVIEDAKREKENLDESWDSLVEKIKKEFANKELLSSDIDNFNDANIETLKNEFNNVISNVNYPTSEFGDLVEIRDQIDYAFNKDKFNTQVNSDLKTLESISKTDPKALPTFNDIKNTIDRLKEQVNNLQLPNFDDFCSKTEEFCNNAEYKKQIREANAKLVEFTDIAKDIQPYTEIVKELLDRIEVLDKNANSGIKSDSLKQALENNKIFELDNLLKDSEGNPIQVLDSITNTLRDKTFSDLTKSEIINDIRIKREALSKALEDSKSFQDRKIDLLEKLKQFKTVENDELKGNATKHDPSFGPIFNATLDKLKEKITAVQLEYNSDGTENTSDLEIKKAELNKLSSELTRLKDASQKLNEASRSVKNAQEAITKVNTSSEIQNKLKGVLESLITDQQNRYNYDGISDVVGGKEQNPFDSETISNNIAKINDLIDVLSKIQEFDTKYTKLTTEKLTDTNFTLSTVLTTNESLNSTNANSNINEYLNNIKKEMDTEVNVDPSTGTINSSKVFDLTHKLSSLELLVDEIIAKIEKYNEIKTLSEGNSLEQRERDMHLWSAKYLGDSIVRAATITNETKTYEKVTLDDLKTARFTLISNYSMKERVYQERKEKLNLLKTQLNDIKTTLNDSIYSEVKNDHKGLLTLLNEQYEVYLNNIAYAGDLKSENNISTYTFEQIVSEQVNSLLENFLNIGKDATAIYDQLDRYKSSADLINSLEATDSKFSKLLEQKFQSVEQIKWFTDRTKELINENKNLWVVNTDAGKLNIKRQELANFILRMDLLFSYSVARERLESYTDDKLTSGELAPLKGIIENLILELKADEEPHSEKYYEKLKVKYLTGNGEYSLSRAEFNSLNLHKAIVKAQAEWDEYQRFIGDVNNHRSETEKMVQLYNELSRLLAQAKENISNPSEVYPFTSGATTNKRHEEMKEKLFDLIDNSFDGILVELKNQKFSELKDLLKEANDVKTFMTTNYSNVQNSPELADYSDVAITALENITKNNSITEMNNAIIAAQGKIKEQKDKIIKYEIEQTKATNTKVQKYIDLFKSDPKYSQVTKIPSQTLVNLKDKNDKLTSIISSKPTEENYKNFISYINSEIKRSFTEVEQAYISFKTTTTFNLKDSKNSFTLFNTEITNSSNASSIISSLTKLGFNSDLESKIREFTDSFNTLTTFATDTILDETDNVELTYNAYKEYADKVYEVLGKYQNLLFKEINNIKDKLDTYFDARKDVNKYLETIRANADDITNFAEIIKSYDIQISSVKAIKDIFENSLTENTSDTITEQIHNIKNAYNSLIKLTEWIKSSTNLEQAFSYLYKPNENDASKSNYLYIQARTDFEDSEFISENFIAEVKRQTEETLTLNGKSYNGILLNSNDALLNYFSEHTILKNNENKKIFNEDNIKVYLIKPTGSANYFEQVFQANPSFKNLRYSLAYVYTNPNKNDPSNAYKDIPDIAYVFNNIETPFMTQKYAKFGLDKFKYIYGWSFGDKDYGYGPTNWSNSDFEKRYVFDYSNAGWTSSNALINMQDALTRGSIEIMKETNKPYVLHDWDESDGESLNTAKDLKISAKINDNISINSRTFFSLRDWTFYSFYNFDNYGDHAWFPNCVVIPMYSKASNGGQAIAFLVIRFEYELSSGKDSTNKFATGFYLNQSVWEGCSTSVVYANDINDPKYTILSSDSREVANKKITDFANEIMSKNNTKYFYPETSGQMKKFIYDTSKLTWKFSTQGDRPLASQTSLMNTYLKQFDFKLRLNEEKGEE